MAKLVYTLSSVWKQLPNDGRCKHELCLQAKLCTKTGGRIFYLEVLNSSLLYRMVLPSLNLFFCMQTHVCLVKNTTTAYILPVLNWSMFKLWTIQRPFHNIRILPIVGAPQALETTDDVDKPLNEVHQNISGAACKASLQHPTSVKALR